MNKGPDLSATTIKTSIAHFFKRFHFILFFVVSIGGLAVCVFLLNGVVELSDQANGYTSNINNTNFDNDTIKKLQNLRPAGQDTEKLDLTGRINPFVE